MKNKVLLTGVKPTDYPHIGNYLGAIKPGIELVREFQSSYFFIADYHALTTVQDPQEMKNYTYAVAATWLACGLDPSKTVIYRQSDVPEIFELAWILSCMAPKGLLNRAHAYKAKLQENKEAQREDEDFGVSMGLYCYPVLMAADILLFNTDVVPVGEDQIQHVEIARDLAQKFNRVYGEVLKLPQHLIKSEKLVPGLDGRKMSKSYGNHIPLFLDSKKLRKLVMRIVTDSLPPEAPKDIKNSTLFDLYKEFSTQEKVEELSQLYQKGVGWGTVKEMLYNEIEIHFADMAKVYQNYISQPELIENILQQGANKARLAASPLMQKIRLAVRGLK